MKCLPVNPDEASPPHTTISASNEPPLHPPLFRDTQGSPCKPPPTQHLPSTLALSQTHPPALSLLSTDAISYHSKRPGIHRTPIQLHSSNHIKVEYACGIAAHLLKKIEPNRNDGISLTCMSLTLHFIFEIQVRSIWGYSCLVQCLQHEIL